MEPLAGYIATIVVSLIVGYLGHLVAPKSKLLCWSPHNFTFWLKQPPITLQTNSLTVQNFGRKEAEDIEIVHESRPDFFEFFPAVPFDEQVNPTGEHIIRVKSLGPREWLHLQLLSYTQPPVLKNVRWRNGQARWIQIQPQRVWPRWRAALSTVLMIVGAGTIAYWLIRAGAAVYHLILAAP